MKYVIILGDGMADWPLEELGGETPLSYADTPAMDALAKMSEIGMVATIPEGMAPGSDTANLSVLGYDHSSDEISTEDSAVLLKAVTEQLTEEGYRFFVGTSYRHCMIQANGKVLELTAPHDVLTRRIGEYLPSDPVLRRMQEKSYEILKDHPLNLKRKEMGLHPANSFWFWGAGTKPVLTSFEGQYHKKGAMISAVDLLKGIAVGAEMDRILVEGANGGLHTNYEGKAQAAVDALVNKGYDFVYVHVEAPDEMGHQGSVEKKVQSIEYLDQRLIRLVKEGLDSSGEDYRMLIMPDHPTPIKVRTHVAEPVPYLLYDSTAPQDHTWHYNEKEALSGGITVAHGWDMMTYLLTGKKR